MQMSPNSMLVIILVICFFYFFSILYLSRQNNPLFGLILPFACLCISIYNLIKLIFIYNPHPTMKEGIYISFFGALSILGIIVFLVAKYIWRKRITKKDG